MELDEAAVEREKLVNDEDEDDVHHPPSIPSTTIPASSTTTKSSTGSMKLNRSGRADPVYREPVVIVSNAIQKAAPDTVASSSVPTPVSPGGGGGLNHRGIFSSGDTSRSQNSTKSHRNSTTGSGTIVGSGTGPPQSTRLVYVNERTGSAHSSMGAGKPSSATTNTSSDKNIKPRKIQRGEFTLYLISLWSIFLFAHSI